MKNLEDLMAMTQEELAAEYLKQLDIKKTMTDEQMKLKDLNKELSAKFEEVNSKMQAVSKTELANRLSGFNIQEKFIEDVIAKSGLSHEMDEVEFNTKLSETIEKYPEYKKLPETMTEAPIQLETVGKSIKEMLQEAKEQN